VGALRILTGGQKTQALRGNIDGHGFFKPGNMLEAHAHWNCQRSARTAAALEVFRVAIAVALRMKQMAEEKVQRGRLAVPIPEGKRTCRPLALGGFQKRTQGDFGQRAV